MGVHVRNLAAIGGVHRTRGDGVINGGVHVVPPKGIGGGETGGEASGSLPDALALDEMGGLLPELDLRVGAGVPAVGDDAVHRGGFTGEIGGLLRGGDGW